MPSKSSKGKKITHPSRKRTSIVSRRRLVLSLVVFLIASFVGAYYNYSGTIQGDYSNILGVSTDRCRTKLDVNCDSKFDSQDVRVIAQHIKKPPSGPAPTATPKASPSSTTQPSSTPKASPGSSTPPGSTPQPSPSYPPNDPNGPYPGAPPCPASAHSTSEFHTLWNRELRCHYDHEHGAEDIFSGELAQQVAATFPGMNLKQLLGNVEIGHTNPSSSMENTHKHGGFKWQFMPVHPEGCTGFEGATHGVNGSAVQIHGFGDYYMELTGRIHSSAALMRQCNTANPTDYGYIYTVQFQDYGQIVAPYQGDIIPFDFNPDPAYNPGIGPYISTVCVGEKPAGSRGECRESFEDVVNRKLDNRSNWISKGPGNRTAQFGLKLFQVHFRLKDAYQLVDWSTVTDGAPPFTYLWLCSRDGGDTYDPTACKWNNSTVQVHEIAGRIPAEWDNLQGFDSDSRVGRITATGFTDRFGTLRRNCTAPNVGPNGDRTADCFPIKMISAFVGTYGSVQVFTPGKGPNIVPFLPEKDIFFCNGRVCNERDAGAVQSGWIGTHN